MFLTISSSVINNLWCPNNIKSNALYSNTFLSHLIKILLKI